MSRRDNNTECKVYIGDLAREADEKELERAFGYYGTLKSVWVARNPPGFGFVEFEDPKDAEDAVRGLDKTNICGSSVRVEHATGKVRPKPWMRDGGGGGRRGGMGGYGDRSWSEGGGGGRRLPYDDRCYTCGERGHLSRDCTGGRRGGGRSGGRDGDSRRNRSRSGSGSRSRKRSYSRSRSGSRPRRY